MSPVQGVIQHQGPQGDGGHDPVHPPVAGEGDEQAAEQRPDAIPRISEDIEGGGSLPHPVERGDFHGERPPAGLDGPEAQAHDGGRH